MATFTVDVDEYDSSDLLSCVGGPDWELLPDSAAVLIHDMQPYYLDVLAKSLGESLIRLVSDLLVQAESAGLPVFASGPRPAVAVEQRGLLGQLWGMGPTLDQTDEGVLGGSGVTSIAKRSYSAFYATDLEVELRRRGRNQLIVVGVFASAGVLATTFDAFARDIQCFVGIDSVADYTLQQHKTALDLIASLTGRVVRTDSLIRRLSSHRA